MAQFKTPRACTGAAVLGDKHRRRESAGLAGAVVEAFTGGGRCLVMGLAVASSEQEPVDAVLEGTEKVSAVRIHPIIDHRRLKASLLQLRELRGPGRCVNALALAAPAGVADRDGWLADAVARAAARGPVLVGRLHGLKRVRWTSGQGKPDLVERFIGRGIDAWPVMQVWEAGDCPEPGAVLLLVPAPEALAAVVQATSMGAMEAPGSAAEVVDGSVQGEVSVAQGATAE